MIKKYFEPKEPVIVLVVNNLVIHDIVSMALEIFKGKKMVTQFPENSDNSLKQFLKKPEGLLIIKAEDFIGMQGRNIVLVGDCSCRGMRNYVMRAVSQLITIQDDICLIDQASSIIVDKMEHRSDLDSK